MEIGHAVTDGRTSPLKHGTHTCTYAYIGKTTYTYGVIPKNVQLFHELCDGDVLTGQGETHDQDGAFTRKRYNVLGTGAAIARKLTVTPSAWQYTCRGLTPSAKWMVWKLMAGDLLSRSCRGCSRDTTPFRYTFATRLLI